MRDLDSGAKVIGAEVNVKSGMRYGRSCVSLQFRFLYEHLGWLELRTAWHQWFLMMIRSDHEWSGIWHRQARRLCNQGCLKPVHSFKAFSLYGNPNILLAVVMVLHLNTVRLSAGTRSDSVYHVIEAPTFDAPMLIDLLFVQHQRYALGLRDEVGFEAEYLKVLLCHYSPTWTTSKIVEFSVSIYFLFNNFIKVCLRKYLQQIN